MPQNLCGLRFIENVVTLLNNILPTNLGIFVIEQRGSSVSGEDFALN